MLNYAQADYTGRHTTRAGAPSPCGVLQDPKSLL